MTIPISPGPFSFLASAGQALGGAAQAITEEREKRLKQSAAQLKQMMDLSIAGHPQDWQSPTAMRLYKELGISPQRPSPGEKVAEIQNRFLAPSEAPGMTLPISQIAPGLRDVQTQPTGNFIPARQLMAAGLPTPSAQAEEQLKTTIAQRQTAAATGGTPGQVAAVTKVPTAETATAGEATAQEPVLNDVADRMVQGLFIKRHHLPTAQEAQTAAATDVRGAAFGPLLTQQHFGAAIERQRRILEAEEAKRIEAESLMWFRRFQALDPLKAVNMEQTRLNDQIVALQNENRNLDTSISKLGKLPGQDFANLPPTDQSAIIHTERNNTRIKALQQRVDELNRS